MESEGELPLGRRAGKSEAAFRTISEVAEDLDVPQHVLRFWEGKFPQVKPLKRGGGRRYYRPEDVALLRRIRDLLYSEGYTIKGVQKLLREGGHKDAPAPPGEAKPQPELDLPLDDEATIEADDAGEALPEMTDGEEDGDAGGFVLAEGKEAESIPEGALQSAIRCELQGILEELEQLRNLLQPRER
jgi:DNA-binding transcriptional MerR regulator